jgi:hypothetical protein
MIRAALAAVAALAALVAYGFELNLERHGVHVHFASTQTGAGPANGGVFNFANIAATADNNAALNYVPSNFANAILRLGYSTPGDSPPILYTPQSTCASRSIDGGACVATSDGKVWVASLPAEGVDVRVWGAVCNGSTADHVAINAALAALSALGGGVAVLPPKTCAYGAAIQQPAGTKLKGAGHKTSILASLVTNIDGIDVNGANATIESLEVNCGAAGTNTAGTCVNVSNEAAQFMIDDFTISGAFTSFYTGTAALITLMNGYIGPMTVTTGSGVVINGGDGQNIINVLCQGSNSQLPAPQPRSCLDVYSTGGLYLFNFMGLLAGNGAIYEPGTGQTVFAVYDYNGDYDSNLGTSISFAPTGTGKISSFRGFGTYASYSNTGVSISPAADATIEDVRFTDHVGYINTQDGIAVSGSGTVTDLVIDGGSICGNNTGSSTYNGISLYSTVNHFTLTGARIGNCDGWPGTQQYAFYSSQTTTNYLNITGNDFSGNNTNAASIALAASNATVMNLDHNIGIDDVIPAVASVSTITAPLNPQFSITGTTTVSNINGLWNGRKYVMNIRNGVTFTLGGNVNPGCTAGAADQVFGVVVGAYTGLKC